MLLRGLLLVLLCVLPTEADLNCPGGFKYDTTYGCISGYGSSFRADGYSACTCYSAQFCRIRNSFDNTAFMSICSDNAGCWLGITCNSTDISGCQWDNGDPVIYTNFAAGQPSTNGACVYFNAHSGLWYSTNCYVRRSSICQIDQNEDPLLCASGSAFYRGKCYFDNQTLSLSNVDSNCYSKNGIMVSIHSQQQNQLYNQYLLQYSHNTYLYSYLGLQYSGGSFRWNDNTPYNYNNFGLQNPSLGSCVLTSIRDTLKTDNIAAGQWFSGSCNITKDQIAAVCVEDLLPPLPVPKAPILCDSQTQTFTNGYGTIYSPGYPRYALPHLYCQYAITSQNGANVNTTLDYQVYDGKMVFYDSMLPGTSPFLTLNYVGNKTVTSNTTVMRIEFTAGSSDTYFVLNYGI